MKTVIVTFASLLVAVAVAPAAELDLPANGWVSWEVPAVADAPAWCCSISNGSATASAACRLDDKRISFVDRDGRTTDAMRIYARFESGKLQRLRTLSADCAVQAKSEIREISPSEQASVEWLGGLVERNEPADKSMRSGAMAALAVHRTPLAYDALADIARSDRALETRKDAVFWLAMLRGREGADLTRSVMFRDADARMREHAAFAMTQTKSPRTADDLIRLATTDQDRNVRGQAWFWLAHTGSSRAETAIGTALRSEKDDHVRGQAIFALSQLPDERAARALISVAEDQTLPRETRKKAVFWLAQRDSDDAIAYLDKVLSTASR